MKARITRRSSCRLCDGADLKLVVPLAPTPIAEKYVAKEDAGLVEERYPLDLYMCLDCSHVQLLDIVDARFLYDQFTYRSAGTKALVDHFDACAGEVCERYRVAGGGLVVDVGSNDGSLLRCFQARGLRVVGIDPATEIAAQATALGIPTIPEFLTRALARRIGQEHGPASVVTAFNVFAHADDLGAMADGIRDLLAPEGVFVFEASYLLDVIDRMLLGTIFHEHMSYHSVAPLLPFLRRHGLQLVDVERVPIQGGSLIGTAQATGGPHPVRPSVATLVSLERERKLGQPETLERFAAKLRGFSERLAGMLRTFEAAGKTVWGYGAARSGTTLIAQMSLGHVIRAIVDDGPEKQGKLSPGDHIPVVSRAALERERPDYTFILGWIHARKIVEANQDYLARGGRFILCFPEIRIIDADNVAAWLRDD